MTVIQQNPLQTTHTNAHTSTHQTIPYYNMIYHSPMCVHIQYVHTLLHIRTYVYYKVHTQTICINTQTGFITVTLVLHI